MKNMDSGRGKTDKAKTEKENSMEKMQSMERENFMENEQSMEKVKSMGKRHSNDEVTMDEYLAAKAELDAVRKEYGIQPKEGKISRAISNFFDKREAKKLQTVNRKKYLLLALFTGWMGGHRFYARQWTTAILYLALFWTGFPFAMTIIDLMAAIPKEADEEGRICV